ncbi:hypothetical protein FIBSPDRAFT_334783 [Athelia psychrophila]|uniref:Uncharacterized protein n=1 Tax=Athelia psychrophila TaxID=1759441 RepID=A0A166Q6G3_9AGAM|nr:hypothetical protein FIBSPDRAFT_334783 [Fibularhizoctonia sp. CBS 109695]
MHLHISTLSSVNCLRPTGVDIDDSEGDSIMTLSLLHHLETEVSWFDATPESRSTADNTDHYPVLAYRCSYALDISILGPSFPALAQRLKSPFHW